ncbi:MAG: TatD family hydrolase [Cocleimonas sp.]
MQLIDSHTHLDFADFDNDRQQVITKAKEQGVSDIIVSATTAKRWAVLKEVADSCACCHPAYGLHPMFMQQHHKGDIDKLKQWLETERAVAIGEIGLDFFIENYQADEQIQLFVAQVEIASELNLPVIIHARKSLDIILKNLRQFKNLTGSIHSFSGSEQQAQQCIDLGFYLSFGGPITYTRATRLRKLVSKLPLDSILLESDSPDQPDASHYQQRNEPAYISNVAQVIAELQDIEVDQVANVTTRNAQALFNLDKNI